MAGLKKSSKKDNSNPNMALVIFLILFILVSIGLGLLAYYGYDGQEALRAKVKEADRKTKVAQDAANGDILARRMLMYAVGVEIPKEDQDGIKALWENFAATPDAPDFANLKKVIQDNQELFARDLRAIPSKEKDQPSPTPWKYETTYIAEWKAAMAEAKKARAMLELAQKEFNDFKSQYDILNAKFEKENEMLKKQIADGNEKAFKAASAVNNEFPKLQQQYAQLLAEYKKKDEEHIAELADRDGQIVRAKAEIAEVQKKLSDRSQGIAAIPQAASGDLHALMLDISRGLPLWDRPLGKVLRVDPINMLVYIDIGSKINLKPDVTFNVFTTSASGRADRALRGTIEVVRVLNETSSVCRITTLYDDKGEAIPMNSEGSRARAIRAAETIIREGDLLFNMTFDMHVFIAGNVNFTGTNADSPAAQNLQMADFIAQLRKQNVIVDGYINLLNGQIEGTITPKTRLLIRGDIAQVNSSADESNRVNQIKEAFAVLKRQAMEQGMFIISAENFAHVAGYRSVQAQANRDLMTPFRPSQPWTGGPRVQRIDPILDAGGAAPPPAAPAPEMKEKQ